MQTPGFAGTLQQRDLGSEQPVETFVEVVAQARAHPSEHRDRQRARTATSRRSITDQAPRRVQLHVAADAVPLDQREGGPRHRRLRPRQLGRHRREQLAKQGPVTTDEQTPEPQTIHQETCRHGPVPRGNGVLQRRQDQPVLGQVLGGRPVQHRLELWVLE